MAVGKIISGTGGGVTMVTGWNYKFGAFTAAYNIGEAEHTGFGDGNFYNGDPVGPVRLTGSASGQASFNTMSTAPIPAALVDGSAMALGDLTTSARGTITLTATTGCTWAASCNIQGVDLTRSEVSNADATVRFGSTGPITQAWDETA